MGDVDKSLKKRLKQLFKIHDELDANNASKFSVNLFGSKKYKSEPHTFKDQKALSTNNPFGIDGNDYDSQDD